MRCAILGNTDKNYSWFVLTYRDGFKHNNIEWIEIDYRNNTLQDIRRKLIEYKPNYVFTHLTFHNTTHKRERVLQLFEDLYKKYNIKIVHTCNDARTVDRYMGDISHCIYSAFVGNYEMLENCKNVWNIPVYYSPYSSLTYNSIAEPNTKFAFKQPIFTGSPKTHTDRVKFLELLKKEGVPFKTFVTQSGGDMRHNTPVLSSSACSILGLCTGYNVNGYIDVRPLQYLGTGACFISRKFKRMDDIIPPDLYFPFNSYSVEDAKLVYQYWKRSLKEDTWPMRCKAFRFIQQNHSSKVRIRQVLDVLEGKREDVL